MMKLGLHTAILADLNYEEMVDYVAGAEKKRTVRIEQNCWKWWTMLREQAFNRWRCAAGPKGEQTADMPELLISTWKT